MRIKNNTVVTKKPKVKIIRKSKTHGGKRVPREESRLESDNPQVAPTISHQDGKGRTYYLGSCMQTACGQEAACMPTQNNTHYYCLCPNNGEPPTEDFKCSRSTVPLTPKPIYNVIPPITSNVSSDLDSSTAQAAVAVGGALFVLLVFCVTMGLLRRRYCRTAGKAQPRIRPGEPLLAERYITNPQYGVCSASALANLVQGNGEDGDSLHVPLLDRSALTFVEEVGEGCFGKVHKGLLKLPNEEQIVAIKVLKESAGRSAEEDFVREVSIMSAFRHPNILSLIGVVYKDNISASPWMVFEYMEWGDLAGVLRGSRNGGRAGPELGEPALLHVALQVARGMQYLASIRFVHRDLAARNCLVGAQLSVKIADFGMSRDIYTCDYYKMGGQRPMPVRWMSPESIVYARFTHESDVWSYGVVLWEIYSRGKQPFYGHNNDGATKLILRGIILVPPEECPRFACELMRACWQTDPQERVTFDEICAKLEDAAKGIDSAQVRLPRPPPLPQDAEGYLKPTPAGPPADYVIPLSDPDSDSDSSDEEEEYT